jgi:putative SOS response-associated peptidase YedK
MQTLHSRMPVVLEPEAGNRWLDGDMAMLADVAEIIPPLRAWPVDRRVNNARNEGEDLIRPDGDVREGS